MQFLKYFRLSNALLLKLLSSLAVDVLRLTCMLKIVVLENAPHVIQLAALENGQQLTIEIMDGDYVLFLTLDHNQHFACN